MPLIWFGAPNTYTYTVKNFIPSWCLSTWFASHIQKYNYLWVILVTLLSRQDICFLKKPTELKFGRHFWSSPLLDIWIQRPARPPRFRILLNTNISMPRNSGDCCNPTFSSEVARVRGKWALCAPPCALRLWLCYHHLPQDSPIAKLHCFLLATNSYWFFKTAGTMCSIATKSFPAVRWYF